MARTRTARAVLASTALTLLLIELGFRLHAWHAPPPRWLDNDKYPSNPRGYFHPCGDGAFCPDNNRAPIHACDAPIDSTKEQVLFIGDSFTFGQGVDAVDAWPSRISFPRSQRRNCAVSGYSSFEIQRDAIAQIEKYHPELVVYGMVLNDFGIYPPDDPTLGSVGGPTMISDFIQFRSMNFDEYVRARQHPAPVQWLLAASETARFFYRAGEVRRISSLTRQGYEAAFRGERGRVGFDRIRAMATLSKRFLVVLFPLFVDFAHYPFTELHRTIRAELARSHVEVLDLLETYRDRDARTLWVYETDQHPNEVAHRLAADAVRDKLLQLGWPPSDAPGAR